MKSTRRNFLFKAAGGSIGALAAASVRAEMMPPVGDSYHIPLGMCLNARIRNLAVVGRCASSTHQAHASVRLQSHCMVMGQGLGTCAALAINACRGL